MSRTAPSSELEAARARVFTNVADALAGAIERDRIKHGRRYTDYRELGRRMGRCVNRTLPNILQEHDTTVSTLADFATITGHRLEIRFVDMNTPVNR